MPSTYDKIATYTVPSAATDYTFTTISSSYTDIVLACHLIPTAGCTGYFQLNGSSSTIYSDTWIVGYGSASAASYRDSNQTRALIGDMTGVTTALLHFQDYSNTTTNKTILVRSSSTGNGVTASVGLFRSTSAVSSIKIIPNGTTWAAGTTFTLYGIKAA